MSYANLFYSREATASWHNHHNPNPKDLATKHLLAKGEQAWTQPTVVTAHGSCR